MPSPFINPRAWSAYIACGLAVIPNAPHPCGPLSPPTMHERCHAPTNRAWLIAERPPSHTTRTQYPHIAQR